MPLIQEPHLYEIFPASSYAEKIPSMTQVREHEARMKELGLDTFDSGLEYERVERKRLNALIKINFKKHGDVPGIAILKSEIVQTITSEDISPKS